MSRHKSISTATRKKLYEKYNHRCAYCGCELEYKDMQIDHVESVYRNNDIAQIMSEKEMYDESNLLPACRQCNFYKKKIGRSTLLLFSYRRPYLKTKTIILLLNKRKYVILYIRISQRKE